MDTERDPGWLAGYGQVGVGIPGIQWTELGVTGKIL